MKRFVAAAAVFAMSAGLAVGAVAAEKFRISLETGPNHIRNISMKKFVEKLQAESKGRLDVEFYEGAALYRDRDVPKALAQGNLEMALPGLWQLDKFVPDAVVLDLPVFYGATAEQIYTITDGPVGREQGRRRGHCATDGLPRAARGCGLDPDRRRGDRRFGDEALCGVRAHRQG